MPLENWEEEGLEKNPNLDLAQWIFQLKSDAYKKDESVKQKLMDAIKAEGM